MNESELIDKYQTKVVLKMLKLEQQQDISSIKFVQAFKVTTLFVKKCFSINFQEAPTNILNLTVNQCQLQTVDGIQQMVQLQALNLQNNQLENIEELKYLINLTTLKLSDNKISDIKALDKLCCIQNLSLAHNPLQNISTVSTLHTLVELNLTKTNLSNISFIKSLLQLQRLTLSQNIITDISILMYNTKLTYLHLGQNQIIDISSLQLLQRLEQLILSDNQIVHIDALTELANLNHLDLRNNFIISVECIEHHRFYDDYYDTNYNRPSAQQVQYSNTLAKIFKANRLFNTLLFCIKKLKSKIAIYTQLFKDSINQSLSKANTDNQYFYEQMKSILQSNVHFDMATQ
ncbi:leucine-rich_repeat domain-containing protein [Hexamita inflata]|uniref:Leucine-rich repeat domain-containing protein n=1 Tax=Hexamita inflata TaxID=28002 RepID=A0AA86N7E8_9EUKA|nr:leucine-rich repeat domain-containing protein [Hexamita inflata]